MTKNVQTSSNAAYWETNSSEAPQELRRLLHYRLGFAEDLENRIGDADRIFSPGFGFCTVRGLRLGVRKVESAQTSSCVQAQVPAQVPLWLSCSPSLRWAGRR